MAFMGLTYFKRYWMECDLSAALLESPPLPAGYRMLAFNEQLLKAHAAAKYESFVNEMDSNVFPCLAKRDGCLRLMREIASRQCFAAEATWLCQYSGDVQPQPVGTIQGLDLDGVGSLQNLGIVPEHRGRNLGTILLCHAAAGYRKRGVTRMQLEVTTDNTSAIRLYRGLGFRPVQIVFTAAEIDAAAPV
ncbi:MAG: N-acetyltransferase [Planctomycetota bacterium]